MFNFYDLNVWINGLKFMVTLEFQLGKNELVRNYLYNAELNALLRILILPVILMRKVFKILKRQCHEIFCNFSFFFMNRTHLGF